MTIDTSSKAFEAALGAFYLRCDGDKGFTDALADALAAALAKWEEDRAKGEPDGWQPIETARNQPGRFLVWDAHHGVRTGRVHVRADHDDWLSYCDAHGGSSKGGIRGTHWMPPPPPPVTEG